MASLKPIDLSKTIKRLEIIKSLILIEEEEEIETHIAKLEQMDISDEILLIIHFLKDKAYSKAVVAIEEFINTHNQLSVYIDPEIEGLKLEIKALEIAINALSDEKADIEKLIHEFGIRHNQELGELIIKILQHRKEQAKGTPQQQETEEDFNTYQQEYEATKDEQINSLTPEEQQELKEKYRKASKLCHPDVVSEEQKELATKLFAELSVAYEKNDLNRVKEILENLEKGNFFVNKSDAINQKQLLQSEMEKLRLRIKELKEQLQTLKESETFKTVSSITDWDEYFRNAKQQLRQQLTDNKI